MKDINEFYAVKCGAETRINNVDELCYRIGEGKSSHFEVWSIQDPRCREIIRERFKLATIPDGDNFCITIKCNPWISYTTNKKETGKTIAEAEIACLEAIHQQENEAER